MNKKEDKPTTKYCPKCQKEVTVTKGAGFWAALLGSIMFFAGIAPGKRQGRVPQCRECQTEIPT